MIPSLVTILHSSFLHAEDVARANREALDKSIEALGASIASSERKRMEEAAQLTANLNKAASDLKERISLHVQEDMADEQRVYEHIDTARTLDVVELVFITINFFLYSFFIFTRIGEKQQAASSSS